MKKTTTISALCFAALFMFTGCNADMLAGPEGPQQIDQPTIQHDAPHNEITPAIQDNGGDGGSTDKSSDHNEL